MESQINKLKSLFPAESEFKFTEVKAVDLPNKNKVKPFSEQNSSVEVTVTANGNDNKYSGKFDSDGIPIGEWKLQRGKDPEISIKFQEKYNLFIDPIEFNAFLGTYTYTDGDIYEGEFKDGKRHGKGKYTFKNGDIYEGEFKNGAKHGKGKYTSANGTIYDGDWENGEKHGQGKCTSANGLIYKGEFKKDKMMMSSNKPKEKNKIPTLLLRSSEMNQEKRSVKYENDKFLDGGKSVEAVVCENSKAVLTEVNQFIENNKENPTEENSKCRIVFDQHGGREGDNDMSIDSESAKKILENLASAGFKEIIISDLACHGGTAYHFLKVAQDFVNEHKVIVKVRSAPEDRTCVSGIKVNNDEKRFTMITIGKDGPGKSRMITEFKPQPKSTEVSNPKVNNCLQRLFCCWKGE